MMADDQDNRDKDRTRTVSDQSSSSDRQGLKRLGEFQIRSSIGLGGMGTVYLAYDESMKRDVALKVLHPSLDIAESSLMRFAREAWIAGQLEHRNIIRVFSRGEQDRYNYIAMELADGGSLSSHIKSIRDSIGPDDSTPVTATSEYQNWLLQRFVGLAEGLEHIHTKGFIHRDIKPHNILLSGENKQFKLTDFGIAHAQDMTRMTKAGDFIGTIKYMSPELLTAHRAKVDKRTDIYSLGVSLYEALTLKLPFEADTDEGFISEILSGHAIPARRRNKRIPRDLETVLLKATHHDPDRRYQTATEFAEDLRRILESRPIMAKRERMAIRGLKQLRRSRVTVLITATAIVVLSLIYYQYDRWRQHEADRNRILQTLKVAVETRTSPFDIEPEWPRLSAILYEELCDRKSDSVALWFFRASTLPLVGCREYVLAEKSTVGVTLTGIRLFETDLLVEKWQSNDLSYPAGFFLAATTSSIWLSLDGFPFELCATLSKSYGLSTAGGVLSYCELSSLPGELFNGRHIVTVRIVCEHYFDVGLFHRKASLAVKGGEVMITLPSGDTLVGVRASHAPPIVLSSHELKPARPLFVDTIFENVEVMTFDEYPRDFPVSVIDSSIADWYSDSSIIGAFYIVKHDTALYDNIFCGLIDERIPVPVACLLQLIRGQSGELLLEGYYRQHSQDLKVAYSGSKYTGGSWEPCGVRDTVMAISRTTGIGTVARTYQQLVNMGQTEATLRLIPSIEAARLFGDVYEFWGDTIEMDIVFQAFDSSDVED